MMKWPVLVGLCLANVRSDDVPGEVTTSSYPSGIKCGSPPSIRCLEESFCWEDSNCECSQGKPGYGEFACYTNSSIHAEIEGSTNNLTTYSKSHANVYLPCRSRFTEFTTATSSSGLQCHFQIFAVIKVLRGRIAVNGIEAHLSVTRNSSTIGGIGIRIEGTAKNSVFTYREWGKNIFKKEDPVTNQGIDQLPDGSGESGSGSGSGDGFPEDEEDNDEDHWGPIEELVIGDGEKIQSKIDQDNFVTIPVIGCDTFIRFRAPNVRLAKQTQVPGISVNITEYNRGQTIFHNSPTYLAEFTSTNGNTEVLHRALQYSAKQYRTPLGFECEETALTYRSYCQDGQKKLAALNTCSFFLKNPDLVFCMDRPEENSSTKSLNAFKLCIWESCQPSKSLCALLKSRVQEAGCLPLTPPEFANKDCNA